MGRPNQFTKLTFDVANGEGVDLTGLKGGCFYALRQIVFARGGGTAASYVLLVGDKTGFTDDPDDGRIAKFESALVSVDTDHTFDPPVIFKADESLVSLDFGWNAGADNDASGFVIVEWVG